MNSDLYMVKSNYMKTKGKKKNNLKKIYAMLLGFS